MKVRHEVRVAVFIKAPFKIIYTLTKSLLYIVAILYQRQGENGKIGFKI